jgi:chorismate mutase
MDFSTLSAENIEGILAEKERLLSSLKETQKESFIAVSHNLKSCIKTLKTNASSLSKLEAERIELIKEVRAHQKETSAALKPINETLSAYSKWKGLNDLLRSIDEIQDIDSKLKDLIKKRAFENGFTLFKRLLRVCKQVTTQFATLTHVAEYARKTQVFHDSIYREEYQK